MTDDELKNLVASLAITHRETSAELKALAASTAAAQQKTDEELKALAASTTAAQQKTDEQMRKTDELFKETDELFKETEAQMKRTDEKLARVCELVGNISNNQGDVAEEFFFHSLANDNHLGAIHFDDVTKNMSKQRGQLQEEYDLVLTNGDSIAIVEVKYKAHENDLEKLDRKMHNFKKLFPVYQSYKQYGAIAAFHINDAAKRAALQRGYFVLQRRGKLVRSESGENVTVL